MSSGRVRVDDELSIHYKTSGFGPTTVLLVPGWTMTTAMFERQLEHFAGSADYRIVTCDPRAHGESTKTADGHYYAQHGRDLGALVDRLGMDRIVLGGWSWGTLQVLAYVNQYRAPAASSARAAESKSAGCERHDRQRPQRCACRGSS